MISCRCPTTCRELWAADAAMQSIFYVGCLKPPAVQEGAWSAGIVRGRCSLLPWRFTVAQQQGRAVQHIERGNSDLWPPPGGLGFLLVNPSVMSRLPWGDCPSNQTGKIQNCLGSRGPTEATKFMLKPSQTFPKSGGLDVGFKPTTDPELENNAFFSLCYQASLPGGGGFFEWLEQNPNPSIAK